MALTDEVQGRVATQLLIELTTHGDTAGIAINTTRLNYACVDAIAAFEQRVGVAFDILVPAHIWPAVLCVLFILQTYPGGSGARLDEARKRWEEAGDALSRTLGSRRVVAAETSSVYAPTQEVDDERPATDRARWKGYVIGQPAGTSDPFGPQE